MVDVLSSFSGVNVAVIGDVMLDKYVWGQVERISPEAPVPVVRTHKESYVAGGAANVAKNITSLGGNASVYGIIGAGNMGIMLSAMLSHSDVNINMVRKIKNRPTTTKTRILGNNQQIVRIDREESSYIDNTITKSMVDELRSNIDKLDVIVVSDYGKGVVTKQLMSDLVELKNEYNINVIIDPFIEHYLWYYGVTLLTPNIKEAVAFVGSKNRLSDDKEITWLGRQFIEKLSCDSVLITRGRDGMSFIKSGFDELHLPTVAKNVFDVSGAGDTVVSVMALGMGAKIPIEDTINLANIAAGIVVGEIGAATVDLNILSKELRRVNR